MDFSEKIAMLRRQKNWSQEELAEKLMVTRQAVSKWESAQSMPDLDKIVQLSELLGVSTDYLLKSDRDAPEAETPQRTQEKASARRVTREEVSRFLTLQESTAPKISLGVALCVWSPIVLIGLTALGSVFHVKIPDSVAGGSGLCVLLVMVAAAVALFLTSGTKLREFEYLEREPIAPDADARELARKQEAPIVTPVSSDVLYFSGEAAFEVKEGKEVTAPVICKPSSARINVVFDPKMDEYFSDYSLKIETEAQKPSSFVWAKATVGPMYFKVGNQEKVQVTVSLTKKENVKAEGTVKTYTLSPADALKLTLKPVVNNGNLGISITIEETTVDHPVDIVIPGDWV